MSHYPCNIQGTVSSGCHSNYYHRQHALWLSSLWKCFSFLAKVHSYLWAREFFKGIGSTGLAWDTERVREACGETWKDPPRFCWIKFLHLDIIVVLLCWEFPPMQEEQISATETATHSWDTASPGVIYYSDGEKMLSLHCRYKGAIFYM